MDQQFASFHNVVLEKFGFLIDNQEIDLINLDDLWCFWDFSERIIDRQYLKISNF